MGHFQHSWSHLRGGSLRTFLEDEDEVQRKGRGPGVYFYCQGERLSYWGCQIFKVKHRVLDP